MKHLRGHIDGEYQDGELRGLSFLAGKRGMGKTTEMARLLTQCRGGVLFFDTLGKHGKVLPSYKILTQPGELKSCIRQNHQRPFRILYQPHRGSRLEHFESVNAIVLATAMDCRGMIYAVDEIDRVCKASNKGKAPVMPPMFNELVEYGRHYWVSMLFTARKPTTVPRGLTSECWEFRLFRTTENRYVDYWADEIDDEQAAQQLRKLEKFEYLLCRDDGSDPQLRGGRH